MRPDERYVTLANRIFAAQQLGRISHQSSQLAKGLKGISNELIHSEPDVDIDALEAINMTLQLIRELKLGRQ